MIFKKTSSKEQKVHIFVYGSLKQGFTNHERFLADCTKIRDAWIHGKMFDCGAFPAVIDDPDVKSTVQGEVFEIPVSRLKDLDWLEGHPDMYQRQTRHTLAGNPVLVYIFQQPTKDMLQIPEGIWK